MAPWVLALDAPFSRVWLTRLGTLGTQVPLPLNHTFLSIVSNSLEGRVLSYRINQPTTMPFQVKRNQGTPSPQKKPGVRSTFYSVKKEKSEL